MKKILFISFCLLLTLSCAPVLAGENASGQTQKAEIKVQQVPLEGDAGRPVAVPAPEVVIEGTATADVEVEAVPVAEQAWQQTQNKKKELMLQIENEVQVKAKSLNELKQLTEQRALELKSELQQLPVLEQKVLQNQNAVREAVHGLLSAEDLAGKIGPQISAIAREFNNSVSSTVRAEEKIQKRSQIIRLFVGGDKEAVETLQSALDQNKEKLMELKQLKDGCECKEEVKTMIEEQIQKMEQEQTRLEAVAEKESKAKGILGWFLKWFKK
jgi:hypothetical protein